MYIYYGLTPAGKTSNRWGSPEAKFILEVTKARDALKKKHNIQRRHKSPFKVDYEYSAKMPLFVHAILTQPCLSFAKKIKIW